MDTGNEILNVKKGTNLYNSGSPVKQMGLVMSGSIVARSRNTGFTISAGQIAGIIDAASANYEYTYTAAEDTTILPLPYSSTEDLEEILKTKDNLAVTAVSQITKYVNDYVNYLRIFLVNCQKIRKYLSENYTKYKDMCHSISSDILPFVNINLLNDVPDIMPADPLTASHYKGVSHMPPNISAAFYKHSLGTAAYIISDSSEYLISLAKDVEQLKDYVFTLRRQLINDTREDFFECLCDLAYDVNKKTGNVRDIIGMINELAAFIISSKLYDEKKVNSRLSNFKTSLASEGNDTEKAPVEKAYNTDPEKVKVILKNSLNTILEYTAIPDEVKEKFVALVAKYKGYSDKNDTSDAVTKTRKDIVKNFYNIYELILFKAINEENIPVIINMFLNFGYIDEELCGLNNAIALFGKAEHIDEINSEHVFTIFEWFKNIYQGKRDPSKNDFDLDYPAYLREEKKNCQITDDMMKKYLTDNNRRLSFEVHNFFVSANRVTNGRISTFCPLLSEDTIIKSIENACLSAAKINNALKEITSVDYSAFYREVLYSDPEHGVDKEFVQQEVLPDIILFPNSGLKGHMWQELGNSKRNTPARFAMPVILQEDLLETMVGLVGRYRWELCRRIQGARWNDLSEKSLTAEYCDYVQFYKKNRDLSDAAKEKLKSSLLKARNNTRELFAKDYEQWILYESKGASRLNKVARRIIFSYCPFSKEYRTALVNNPSFKELFERYSINIANKKKRIDGVYLKITKNGGEITKELQDNLDFYNL